MLSILTSLKLSTGLTTNCCSRSSTDSASAVPCWLGSKTISLTTSKGSPFSESKAGLSLCHQARGKINTWTSLVPHICDWMTFPGDVATYGSVFADDTRCFRPMKSLEDGACQQRNLEHINPWCDFWQIRDLNKSKCVLRSITRNASLFQFPYQLSDVQVRTMEAQKDLGVLVTKTSEMKLPGAGSLFGEGPMIGWLALLGAAFGIHDQRVRYFKLLYSLLVRSDLASCSQVWAPQAVNLILDMESQNSAARNKIRYIFAVSVRS